ncbi:hypothetical protein Q3G72_020980 [Acer saccharum]|nr:hypothetical protein Q3G72_020980 [Acer saccharum]
MASAVDAEGDPIPSLAVLTTVSKHIATRCQSENIAFLKCKKKDPNPEKCLDKELKYKCYCFAFSSWDSLECRIARYTVASV